MEEKNGVRFIIFKKFEETGLVRHCFSTRQGGISEGCYQGLNLGFNRGDDKANVQENFRRIAGAVGFDYESIVFANQVHGVHIHHVTSEDKGKGILYDSDILNTDGLITEERTIVLATFYADCVPLFFLDPIKKIIALSHAGWRGTVNQIASLTVERMIRDFDCSVKDILAGIGPSIGQCCFEVDRPVADEFCEKLSFSKGQMIENESVKGKYNIDLKEVNRQILLKQGLNEANIEVSAYCTTCDPDLFYSHRAMGKDRGSMVAFLTLQ